MIHLDTSYLIRALVTGSAEDRRLRSWLAGGDPVGISAIAWAEFLCGPVEGRVVDLAARIVREPAPFLVDDAETAARLFSLAGSRRGTLADCMIAAVALRLGATLATANPTDFSRILQAGLRLVTEHA